MRIIPPSKLTTPTTTTTNTLLAPTATVVVLTTPSSSSSSSSTTPHSPWHFPIPYLFGGLATIMGLIAFALLMLACSYWRLTRTNQDTNLVNNNNNKESDESQNKEPIKAYEEKILVIMAGEDKPTFLATPAVCHNSSSSLAHPIGSNNFDKHLGNSEECDMSQKEILDTHVVVPASTQENGTSQHELHSQ